MLTKPKSGLYNCGTGTARSFNELAKSVFEAMGEKKPKIEYIDMPAALKGQYQYFTEAKMTRLRAAGYNAGSTSLEDGVKRYVQDYLAAEDPYY